MAHQTGSDTTNNNNNVSPTSGNTVLGNYEVTFKQCVQLSDVTLTKAATTVWGVDQFAFDEDMSFLVYTSTLAMWTLDDHSQDDPFLVYFGIEWAGKTIQEMATSANKMYWCASEEDWHDYYKDSATTETFGFAVARVNWEVA